MAPPNASEASRTASPRSLSPVDRWRVILELVAAEQTIHVAQLAAQLGVSDMTIRRDLRRLERDGFLRQTYGGAMAHITRSFDVSFNARALQHAREKRLIGMRATELVGDARTVFLGIGSTAEQFARYLAPRDGLIVVTGSLPIAGVLGTRPVRVVVLGGNVLRDELSCVGPAALRTLATYRFDLAVIGAAGLSAAWGVTELTDDEAEVQRSALERSGRVIVIADGSKLGRATNCVVTPAGRLDAVVTDESAPASEVDALRKVGVAVEVARARRRTDPPAEVAIPRIAERPSKEAPARSVADTGRAV